MSVAIFRFVGLWVCSAGFAIDLGGCGGSSGHPVGATDGGEGDGGGSAMPMCQSIDPAHFNVDVPSVTLSGVMTVNGAPLPAAEPFSSLSLRASAGDVIPIGALGVAGKSAYGPTAIVAGSYDLYYSWNEADTTTNIALPRNTGALVQAGVLLTSSQAFNIDLPTITLSGVITVNGAVPSVVSGSPQIELRNPVTHDKLFLGAVGQASYVAKQILPGTYDVYYVWKQVDSAATPRNFGALVRSGVALTQAQTLNVDVPMIGVSGNLTINGATPSTMLGTAGTIELRNPATGDIAQLALAGSGHYGPVPVVPGTYDVYYRTTFANPVAPAPMNGLARLRTGVAISGAQPLDVDVPSVSVSGTITLDGAVPAGTGGLARLIDPVTGDFVPLGALGNYGPVWAIAGSYEIHAGNSAAANPGPRNSDAMLRTVALTASQVLDIDIPTITLSVTPSLNGAALSVPAGFATLSLQDPVEGGTITLGDLSTPAALSARIVPGSYEIYYNYLGGTATSPPAIPRNQHVQIQAATSFTTSGSIAVDIPTTTLSGAITVNGAAATATTGVVALRAIGAASGGALLGTIGQASYTVPVIPGVYSVHYESTTSVATSAVPSNPDHELGCVTVTR